MKKILLSVSIIAVFLSLVTGVNAHPGRTDSNGGHTDHSTGEYHYHHGYSAHDHYDMDGDGDIDCPYEFNDKTDHSSVDGVISNEEPITETSSEFNSAEDGIAFGEILKAMFEALLPAISIGIAVSCLLSYLFFLLFGDDKGCSITIISLVVISIIAYISLIVIRLS